MYCYINFLIIFRCFFFYNFLNLIRYYFVENLLYHT